MSNLFWMPKAENTNLRGKYHCTGDFLFMLFWFEGFVFVELPSISFMCLVKSKLVKK